MSTPPTPIHPAPNEEVHDLPTESLPQTTLEDIDLNPELYDSDYKDSYTSLSQLAESRASNASVEPAEPHNALKRFRLLEQTGDAMDSETSMEDVDLYEMKQITLPFDEGYELFKSEFLNTKSNPNDAISDHQQSKLINYIDESLLSIQRKYIKNQTEVVQLYSFQELLEELVVIVNLIWMSIEQKNELFGQVEYYIKILGDLEDYIAHYESLFDDHIDEEGVKIDNSKLIQFFTFFQKIDLQLSLLLDGYSASSNRLQKANNTQLIRLIPIVSRLRIVIISKLESIRIKLNRLLVRPPNEHIEGEAKKLLNLLELEISRLFEGILERSA
ncbi:uncharacterized protein RJT20DRAFT_21649 [Scheffersomyces xylosifermentans]|uniref:uncharacterized protein n=1 Tax=Scheffersomyces xylosifermentans TaxID=1304137 RepID=UPI00315D2FC9